MHKNPQKYVLVNFQGDRRVIIQRCGSFVSQRIKLFLVDTWWKKEDIYKQN